jgi:hypothetical protein
MANLYAEHAREIAGVGPEWHMAAVASEDATKAKPDRFQVTLMTAPLLADGKVAWEYADRKGKKVIEFSQREHVIWLRDWEKKTGLCYQCSSNNPGKEWIGWDATTGDKFQTCRRCNGTNKAQAID